MSSSTPHTTTTTTTTHPRYIYIPNLVGRQALRVSVDPDNTLKANIMDTSRYSIVSDEEPIYDFPSSPSASSSSSSFSRASSPGSSAPSSPGLDRE